LVDTEHIFVDSTHVKACANSKKMRKRVAHEQALWYEQELKEEIQKDRAAHGKKPLKDNDKNDSPPPTASGGESFADETESQIPEGAKTQKCSTSDPESGWFRKGEHKHVFAYAVETACDKHGWILGYTVHPGNEHDSRTFPLLYEKIKDFKPDMMIMDAGYKTPAIAHLLLEDGIQPLFPYKRPMTKEGFFKKYEYAYDEYYDCYVCPGNQVLKYSTTNRDGYREYKSCGLFCSSCPYLHQCTESKDHVKVITRHVWEEYMEKAEDIRHTIGNKEIYQQRKETIERLFGTAKEQHRFRYTQYIGKARMEMKAGLTFACMNLKKLAKILEIRESKMKESWSFLRFLLKQRLFTEKWCWG
ncbi:IS1182 family transposase, partial [[Ruminococcus] torques]|uniref:IS1182 family transposase n=1 Tax=[Ruminococcus] torques TaxID=33039 RepID=UPI0012BC3485